MSSSSNASPLVDYAAANKYLFERINYEKVAQKSYSQKNFRLARMHKLLAALGNPHRKYPTIHIAGTKGKGSVAWLTAEALRYNGLRVGLYTSPHLTRLEERFVVDGLPCSPDEFVTLLNEIHPHAEMLAAQGDGAATFFELTTAIGFLLFATRKVDVAVVEVGLGGRLDSTNVVLPEVSVITSISFDHQQQLGNTIPLIAQEKAGIIKPAIPVVSGVLNPEAIEVIRAKALQNGCEIRELSRDFSAIAIDEPSTDSSDAAPHFHAPSITRFAYRPAADWLGSRERTRLTLKMKGQHQANNAATAIATLDMFARRTGIVIADEAIARACAETQVAARMQFFPGSPSTILDSAHNPASIAAMLETLNEYWPRDYSFRRTPRVLVYASSSDKEYEKLLRMLMPQCDHLVLTQYHNNPRAVEHGILRRSAQQVESELVEEAIATKVERPLAITRSMGSPTEALRTARQLAGPKGLVCVTGSFFLAAELIDMIQAKQNMVAAGPTDEQDRFSKQCSG